MFEILVALEIFWNFKETKHGLKRNYLIGDRWSKTTKTVLEAIMKFREQMLMRIIYDGTVRTECRREGGEIC